jgi:hypothetical protein
VHDWEFNSVSSFFNVPYSDRFGQGGEDKF